MSIDIQCSECKKRFRVPDKFGGRRIKCPNCEEPIAVQAAGDSAKPAPAEKPGPDSGVGAIPTAEQRPAAPAEPAGPELPAPPAAEAATEDEAQIAPEDEGQWYLQTDDGEQYGPVDREELNAWVAEGRIDGACQLLCDGWDQWQWADEVFPQLAEEASTEDSPITVRGDSGKAIAGPAVPAPSDPKLKAAAAPRADSAGGIDRTLAETRPWVLLMAILWFAIAGLGALVSLVGLIVSAVGLVLPGILMSVVMLASYGLLGWPAYHLLVYAQRLAAYGTSSGTAELEQALVAQKSFWRATGIMALVAIGLWLVAGLVGSIAVLVAG